MLADRFILNEIYKVALEKDLKNNGVRKALQGNIRRKC